MAEVTLDSVVREVNGTRIIDSVSFTAAEGELLGLIGPSGAGKTSLIRVIAGLDKMTSGSVYFDGNDMSMVATRDRDIGMVTQGNTLFPTERVRGNLRFPLWARGARGAEVAKRVEIESRAHNIEHILERWPETLSGGEQQLTQIARALIRRPKVFLMDEPLANLDPPTRHRLRRELVDIQKGYGVTTIYVAHRAEEVMSVPDRLIAIEHGRVVQTGSPNEIYQNPTSLTIARLTGDIGTITGTVVHDGNGLVLTAAGFTMRMLASTPDRLIGEEITIGVRCDDVRISPSGPLTATVGSMSFSGPRSVRQLHTPIGTFTTTDCDAPEHTTVNVWLEQPHLFDSHGRLAT